MNKVLPLIDYRSSFHKKYVRDGFSIQGQYGDYLCSINSDNIIVKYTLNNKLYTTIININATTYYCHDQKNRTHFSYVEDNKIKEYIFFIKDKQACNKFYDLIYRLFEDNKVNVDDTSRLDLHFENDAIVTKLDGFFYDKTNGKIHIKFNDTVKQQDILYASELTKFDDSLNNNGIFYYFSVYDKNKCYRKYKFYNTEKLLEFFAPIVDEIGPDNVVGINQIFHTFLEGSETLSKIE